MAPNNSLIKNDQPNKPRRKPSNVYFDNVFEKLPEQN